MLKSNQKDLILSLLNKDLSTRKGKLLQYNKTLEMYNKQLNINITIADIQNIEIKIEKETNKINELIETIEAIVINN